MTETVGIWTDLPEHRKAERVAGRGALAGALGIPEAEAEGAAMFAVTLTEDDWTHPMSGGRRIGTRRLVFADKARYEADPMMVADFARMFVVLDASGATTDGGTVSGLTPRARAAVDALSQRAFLLMPLQVPDRWDGKRRRSVSAAGIGTTGRTSKTRRSGLVSRWNCRVVDVFYLGRRLWEDLRGQSFDAFSSYGWGVARNLSMAEDVLDGDEVREALGAEGDGHEN